MKNRKTWMWSVTSGAVALVALGAWAASEVKLTIDQVPAAVKATILAESAGSEIREIERETQNGRTIYEAVFVLNGMVMEIEVAPDGQLLGREVEGQIGKRESAIPADQVPAPARKALQQLAGGAKIIRFEQDIEYGTVVYEARWLAGGLEHEAEVTADGTLIEQDERIPLGSAPAAVRSTVARHFGPNANVVVEMKTVIVYEIEARINGKPVEIIVLPTGQVYEHDEDDDQYNDGDDDDHHDKK